MINYSHHVVVNGSKKRTHQILATAGFMANASVVGYYQDFSGPGVGTGYQILTDNIGWSMNLGAYLDVDGDGLAPHVNAKVWIPI